MEISKAQESLDAAKLCYGHKLYNSTVSRAYYAMFQAAVVALESAGVLPNADTWATKGCNLSSRLSWSIGAKPTPES